MIDRLEDENRKRVLDLIIQIPKKVPEGWDQINFSVGGLLYIGFSEVCSEKLICISSQGQSVIDCKTGKKTYCDENYDEDDLIASAQETGDEIIRIAGIGGGGMRHYSADGSRLELAAPFWPKEQIIFMPNFKSFFESPRECSIIFDDYEIRTFGFSRCGNYIAACNSSTLTILKKSDLC